MTGSASDRPATHAPLADPDLIEKSDAVCRMGSMMLTSGTGSYRVKQAMGRVAAALGIEELEAQVSLTEIVATTRARGGFRTQVVEVPVPTVDADRIRRLLRVSLRATPGLTAAELQDQLDEVEAARPLFPGGVVVVGAAIACASFAFLNNGGWLECLAAGFAAASGKLCQLAVRRFKLNQLVTVALAAIVACVVYVAVAGLVHMLVPGLAATLHEAAFTSAVLFLVPGFPLMTAALDLARFDFTSGISRLMYVSMITLAASLGAWVIALAFGLSPAEAPVPDLPAWLLLALRVATSFVGVLGFALTFNTPLRPALVAAAIGAAANAARLTVLDGGANPLLCAAAATLAVGLLAGWASQRILAPRIILSVPAVLIMIPGATTYRALVAMIGRDGDAATTNAIASLSVVVSLAAGLAVARMLTDPAWTTNNPTWTRLPRTHAQQVLSSPPSDAD